jgi:hypothetical protein
MSKKAGVPPDLPPKKEQLLVYKPQLSVVIAHCACDTYVGLCFWSLEAHWDERSEFIIVDRSRGEVAETFGRDSPWVNLGTDTESYMGNPKLDSI